MSDNHNKINSIVRRERAEEYLFFSLVAFAGTVIFTRAFLHLTGFPQLGNDILHIAHALWGGLFLFVAVLLPLTMANRWALQTSAILSGIGIGLFIDEVGKFITQNNDYFYPPAASLIYGFFLLCVFVFVLFRRSHHADPRQAMYNVLDGFQDILDGDLDEAEADRIEGQARPSLLKRIVRWTDSIGQRLGRRVHRTIVASVLILWLLAVIGYIVVLVHSGTNLNPQVLRWRDALIGIQSAVGVLMLIAVIAWFSRNEETGLRFAILGFLLSLVALQMYYFYISQFSATVTTLVQFGFLQTLTTYRRWYF
ncbi:MAG: hypothetical protein P8Z34_16285 [Anaerolineales bacterium]